MKNYKENQIKKKNKRKSKIIHKKRNAIGNVRMVDTFNQFQLLLIT